MYGGNLCRCTGYRSILHAMRSLAATTARSGQMQCEADPFLPSRSAPSRCRWRSINCRANGRNRCRSILRGNSHWFRPTRLAEAQELKRRLSDATTWASQVRFVVGNTARAIYPTETARSSSMYRRSRTYTSRKSAAADLAWVRRCRFKRLLELAHAAIEQRSTEETLGLRELVWHGQWVAGIQVGNAGSIGGNIFIVKSHTRQGMPFPVRPTDGVGTLERLGYHRFPRFRRRPAHVSGSWKCRPPKICPATPCCWNSYSLQRSGRVCANLSGRAADRK